MTQPVFGQVSEAAPATSSATASPRRVSHPGRRSSALVAFAACLAALLLVPLLLDGIAPLSFQTRLLVQAALITLAGLFATWMMSGKFGLWRSLVSLRLGPWMGASFTVTFGLATALWAVASPDIVPDIVDPKTFWSVTPILLFSILVFLVGYQACPSLIIRSFDRLDFRLGGRNGPLPSARSALLLLTVAFLGQLVLIASGRLGYLSPSAVYTNYGIGLDIATKSAIVIMPGIAVAGWAWSSERSIFSASVFFGSVAIELPLSILSAGRERVLLVAVAVAAGLLFGRAKTSKSSVVLWLLGLALLYLLLTPVNAYIRAAVNSSQTRSVQETVGLLSADGLAESYGSAIPGGKDTALFRASRVADVAVIVARTGADVPYKPITELATAPFLGLVPRAIWPDKPVVGTGEEMNTVYYGLAAGSASAMTPVGDLWRHGGYLPVLIGFVALGFVVRAVDSRALGASSNPNVLVLPLIMFGGFVKWESDFLSLVTGIPSFLLTAWACGWILRLGTRQL